MKNPIYLLLATATIAWAVPSEINYQGRLTDANGDAVTGDVSMSLNLFDAATGGNEIYSEDIGTVSLDDNGVYSFQFGAGGASVVAIDELVATTDGSSQVFNATLSELPIDGSVSISDGTYTWSQASGSSNSSEFTGSVTASTGAISAIYLSGAPNSGTEITASYNNGDSGVGGALSSHNGHWLELSVDGVEQAPRERVLSVPFAQVAGKSLSLVDPLFEESYFCRWDIIDARYNEASSHSNFLPQSLNSNGNWYQNDAFSMRRFLEPNGASAIESIKAEMLEYSGDANPNVSVLLKRYSTEGGHETIAELNTNIDDSTVQKIYSERFSPMLSIDFATYSYYIQVTIGTGGQYKSGGGGINSVSITYSNE